MAFEAEIQALQASVNATLAARDATIANRDQIIAEQAARIKELEAVEPPPVDVPPVEPPVEPPAPPTPGTFAGPTGGHTYPNVGSVTASHEVDASWGAISGQVTACQAHSGVCRIVVRPGTLAAGFGAASTSNGSLANIGSVSKRIVVTPRDGYGTVKVAGSTGVAFVSVRGVILDRIDFSAASGVMVRNCETFAIGYTTVKTLNVTANAGNGVRDIAFVEVVGGPEQTNGVSYDRVQVKSAGGFNIAGLKFIGCYFAPNYKPNGSSGHCDTIQFVTTSGTGTIQGVEIVDSVVFQSADQGIMAANIGGGALRNSVFLGGTTGQLRYPMYAGGDPITLANMLHGGWQSVAAENITVAGSIGSSWSFTTVTGSSSTQGARGFAALGTLIRADVDRIAPLPNPGALWR